MRIFQKTDIIDPALLDKALEALPLSILSDPPGAMSAAPSDPTKAVRQAVLDLFQQALTTGKNQLHQNHLDGASAHTIVHAHSYLMDTLLHRIYRLVHQGKDDGKKTFSLVAIGGYGRGELAPFSDIDLLFLLPPEALSAYQGKEEGKRLPIFTRTPIKEEARSVVSSTVQTTNPIARRVEQMLYYLWDLRLDVGHSVRTIDECVQLARQNVEIRTSMLESRFLSGDQTFFKSYHDTLFAQVMERGPEAFMRAKLVEQNKRRERFGNSLFYLEPNVKENPGGLRDLQTFSWISKYRYQVKKVRELIAKDLITQEEYDTFIHCQSFLKRVRNALHYRAGRREDRLTFQHQMDIATEFGYKDRRGLRGVEQFMRRYYQISQQVGNLSWIFLRKYQEEHRRVRWWNRRKLEGCFELHGDKVTVTNPKAFRENPLNIMRLFEVAQRHLKGIHPDTMLMVNRDLRLVNRDFRNNPEVAALFLKMLDGEKAVAWVLRRMSISGILGRYIPEFGRIIGQSQYDLFHVYTVDEHTILAIEALRHIKSGRFSTELPICTALMKQLQFYEKGSIILYLSVMFHDIAKGSGGDHQLKGALIAHKICLRLGLSESETGMVCWLVGRHLNFSRTAFRRDISDPETIINFARQVGTQKRLEFLLLLTVADIRAVGPGVWNLWKAELLRRLYHLTLGVLQKGAFQPEELREQAETQKQAVLHILEGKADPSRIRLHLERFESDYFLRHEANTIARHTLAMLAEASPLETVEQREKSASLEPVSCVEFFFFSNPVSDTTELLIHTQDQSGLMARISGGLAMEGVNILSADITTTRDGMALDVFVVQNSVGKAIADPRQFHNLKKTLTEVMTNRALPQPFVAVNTLDIQRRHSFDVPFSIETEDTLDAFTILEITSLDRVGLLFTITREIEQHDIQIRTAKISTYGERAVDVFYVRDIYGLKLVPQKIAAFSRDLKNALEAMDGVK